jgi:hypothetical protein
MGFCQVPAERPLRCPHCNKNLPTRVKWGGISSKPYKKLAKELDEYRHFVHDSRLDGAAEISRFLGIGQATFYKRIKKEMLESGVLFRRKHPGGHAKISTDYFTFKELIFAWLIRRKVL